MKERLQAHGGVVVLEVASRLGMASFYSQPNTSQHIGSPVHEEVDRNPEAPLFTISTDREMKRAVCLTQQKPINPTCH